MRIGFLKEFTMLVLARQKDQSIIIGEDIEVTVVDIRGDKCRLGINAPREIPVHRKEVYELVRQKNADAAKTSCDPRQLLLFEITRLTRDFNLKSSLLPESRNYEEDQREVDKLYTQLKERVVEYRALGPKPSTN